MRALRTKNIKLLLSSSIVLALAVSLFAQPSIQAAQTVTGVNDLINVDPNNSNNSVGGSNRVVGISASGTIVIFTSQSSALVTSGTGAFERNVSTGTTTRIDVSASGVVADNPSSTGPSNIAISETGRYVAFLSLATNLIDGTTAPFPLAESYLKDMQTGSVSPLLLNSDGSLKGDINTLPIAVSNDGRFILFQSSDTGSYISGARNGNIDPLLLDTSTRTWTLLDAPTSGGLQAVDSVPTSMSCDGSFALFQSTATNLIPGYTGSGQHVFLVDLRNGKTVTDLNAGATADSMGAHISCNSEYIAFDTKDRTFVNPTPSGMNTSYHLVDYNRITGTSSYADQGGFDRLTPSVQSISNMGDVVFPLGVTDTFGSVRPQMSLAHVSDGSGTIENLEKNGSSYISFATSPDSIGYISADGKYAVIDTSDAAALGFTVASNSNVIRVHTGL